MQVRIWFRDWVISFYVLAKFFKIFLTFRSRYFQKRSITPTRNLLKPKKGIYRAITLRKIPIKSARENEIFLLILCQAPSCCTVCLLDTVILGPFIYASPCVGMP